MDWIISSKEKFFEVFLVLLLVGTILVSPINAQELPQWLKAQRDYIKQSGDTQFESFIKKMETPVALKYGRLWKELLGYDAYELVVDSKIATDIKPGVVINSKNLKDFPGAKQLLPESLYRCVSGEDYLPIAEIKVVPTVCYYWNDNHTEWSKKNKATCSIDPQTGELKGWIAGTPFVHPKNGEELIHNIDRFQKGLDQFSFAPIRYFLYDRSWKLERTQTFHGYWRNYWGRTVVPPMPVDEKNKDIFEKGAVIYFAPFDLKGWTAIRTRYKDPTREDDLIAYIPGLRRIRRLSGANVFDPLPGSDVIWEDWGGNWLKLSNIIWPRDFKIVGEEEMLSPVVWDQPAEINIETGAVKDRFERRKFWVVELKNKNPKHIYGKSVYRIDKERFQDIYDEYYDQKGRLYRTWHNGMGFDYEKGHSGWRWSNECDKINKHYTQIENVTNIDDPSFDDTYFDLRFLNQMAR